MNYQRIKASFLFRAGYGLRFGLKLFGTLVTTLATVFTIFAFAGITCDLLLIYEMVGVVLLIAMLGASIKSRVDHLPDSIIIDDAQDVRYELHYETKEICKRFNQETAKYFGRDCVDDLLVESWRVKIPEAFIYLKNQHDEPCAALCIFGLRHSFMEQFVKGRVSECDIDQDDVLDLAACKKSASLYLPVIVVDHPHTPIGHRRALVMVWGLIIYLKKIYGLRRTRKIYAVPINVASENLLKRLGFQIAMNASGRKDKHDLYFLELNKKNVATALERIGDYSATCEVRI